LDKAKKKALKYTPLIVRLSVESMELMRRIIGSHLGVNASGGICDKETALAMIRVASNRIGTSARVALCGFYAVIKK
jgi:deoxyribose-phosphate aldolase